MKRTLKEEIIEGYVERSPHYQSDYKVPEQQEGAKVVEERIKRLTGWRNPNNNNQEVEKQ